MQPLIIDYDNSKKLDLARAFYATNSLWDTAKYPIPFTLNEDQIYVMAKGFLYRPMPVDKFRESLEKLFNFPYCFISPENLKESIDYDPSSDGNKDYSFVLTENVLLRMRKDHSPDCKKEDLTHTLMMIGSKENIENLAGKIDLPHPFDDSLYPFKKMFKVSDKLRCKVLEN